jgi:hypothetical protein
MPRLILVGVATGLIVLASLWSQLWLAQVSVSGCIDFSIYASPHLAGVFCELFPSQNFYPISAVLVF